MAVVVDDDAASSTDRENEAASRVIDGAALYNCTARAFARAAFRVMDLIVASPSFFSAAS